MSGSLSWKKEFAGGWFILSFLSFILCWKFLHSPEPNFWVNTLPFLGTDLGLLLYLQIPIIVVDRLDNVNKFNLGNFVLVYLFILMQDIVFVGIYCYYLQEYGVKDTVVEILTFALPFCWILRGFGLFIVALKGYFKVDKSGYEEIGI